MNPHSTHKQIEISYERKVKKETIQKKLSTHTSLPLAATTKINK